MPPPRPPLYAPSAVSDPKTRKVPTGRWGRALRMMSLRGLDRRMKLDPENATRQLAETLGGLRGIAAKGAQLASYVDGVVPPEHRALFESELGRLREDAPQSDPRDIRRTVEAELGGPVASLFTTFEDRAFASGSLGQVHRATLADGRVVAVKVQHTDIARAVESDLRNMAFIEGLVGPAGGRRQGSDKVVALLSARFREELDYRREAEHLRFFGQLYAGDPDVRIPALVPERSAGRVLTTELVEGVTLAEACTAAPPVRRRHAEALWRFVFKSNFVARQFNADPHPGNYVFAPDGAVWFLDFGCVQPIAPALHEPMLAMHVAALEHDDEALRRAVSAFFHTQGGPTEDRMIAHSKEVFAPLLSSPYRVTHAYAAHLFHDMQALTREVFGVEGSPVAAPPPEMTLMSRQQTGFYSVLAQLDVEADYAAVSRRVLPEVGARG